MTAATAVYRPESMLKSGYSGLTVFGQPSKDPEATDENAALAFDGVRDGLVVAENLLARCRQFEIEAEFFPSSGGNREQRFFHIQAAQSEDRILMETRLTPRGQWYADSCVVSGKHVVILVDERWLHPLDRWYRYTLSYDGTTLWHRIDGVTESLREQPGLAAPREGVTAIGIRATGDYHFRGIIRRISCAGIE